MVNPNPPLSVELIITNTIRTTQTVVTTTNNAAVTTAC